MTLRQTYQKGKMLLEKAGIETPAFDAVCLFEKVFGMDRQKLMTHGMEPAEEAHAAAYWELCEMRAQGRPLQYILGEWPFMDFTLCVGEGVLVPREETELLVYTAAERLRVGSGAKGPWKGIDLCGGKRRGGAGACVQASRAGDILCGALCGCLPVFGGQCPQAGE